MGVPRHMPSVLALVAAATLFAACATAAPAQPTPAATTMTNASPPSAIPSPSATAAANTPAATGTPNADTPISTAPITTPTVAGAVPSSTVPGGTPTAMSSGSSANVPPEAAALVQSAKQQLANQASVPVDQIQVVSVTRVQWPDSALGCPQPGQMYSQIVTPGYRLVLAAAGKTYEYHTNLGGRVIYCANPK